MKDKSITDITDYLQSKLGKDKVLIMDHWDGDNCALGLTNKSNSKLVYISTYMKKEGQYYVALEVITKELDQEYENTGTFDNVNIELLEKITKEHLEVE